MKTAVVTGANGGLGRLIADQLEAADFSVQRWDINTGVDVTDELCLANIAIKPPIVDVLVNCAGFNKLAAVPDLSAKSFDLHMNVNARAILLCTQALLPALAGGGTVCNVISNASHMPMRMSLAYNASKAAAAMITRQMARELWDTHHITVFGVSPNRLAGTPMSNSVDEQVAKVRGWTLARVHHEQVARLPIGEETDTTALAEFIGFLLSTKQRNKYLHGAILDYGI